MLFIQLTAPAKDDNAIKVLQTRANLDSLRCRWFDVLNVLFGSLHINSGIVSSSLHSITTAASDPRSASSERALCSVARIWHPSSPTR